jgi:hypothetical protein
MWPVSRGCLLLNCTLPYFCICRGSVLPCTRFCICFLDFDYVLRIVNVFIFYLSKQWNSIFEFQRSLWHSYFLYVKLIQYQFWCTWCAFWLLKSLQWCLDGNKIGNPKTKLWKLYKIRKRKTNQILCHEIKPNPSKDRAMYYGDNPSFWDELMKFTFFLRN